jgi:hypothetical protein
MRIKLIHPFLLRGLIISARRTDYVGEPFSIADGYNE